MKSKRMFILLFVVVIGVTFYSAFTDKTESMEQKPEVGFKAPPFELPALNSDQLYTLESAGKPLVVNFWASWCGPCELEAPDLAALYEKYQDQVEFYAINLTDSDTLAKAEEFVEKYQFTFPVLLDQKGEASTAYRILAVPTTYFIDQNGVIIHKHFGLATKAELEASIRKLVD